MEQVNNITNEVKVKNYILDRHPKKGDMLVGGKVNGFIVEQIIKKVKHYGTMYYLHINNQNVKRVVLYTPSTKKISSFQKNFLTTTQGTYYRTY